MKKGFPIKEGDLPLVKRKKGQRAELENEAYEAIYDILHRWLWKKTWMNQDLFLGTLDSGVRRATAEFKLLKQKIAAFERKNYRKWGKRWGK